MGGTRKCLARFSTREMTAISGPMDFRLRIKSAVLLVYCLYAMTALAADSISGKVRNQTINRPSAGDDVVLLRMGNGMEEEARTRTDAQGAFSLPVNVPDAQHVVRVLHQGVNYDQTVSGAAPLEISVYDAVPKIPGLSGNLGMAQVESDGAMLKVTEMYSINNVSSPPVTQSGPHNLVISVPPKAVVDSVVVKRAAGVWVTVQPAPITGSKGSYAVDFPLRPGDTLFKFVYRMPQEHSTFLHIRPPYPVQNFAVVHPPSISFKASRPQAFSSPGLVQGLKLEQAVSRPIVGEVPAFEISGVGAAPAGVPGTKAPSGPPPIVSAAPASTSPANSGSADSSTSNREIWALGAGFVCLLAVALTALWRNKRVRRNGSTPNPERRVSVVEALKQELLQLETERLHGTITAEQYDSSRHALDLSIRRALSKGKG